MALVRVVAITHKFNKQYLPGYTDRNYPVDGILEKSVYPF